MKKADRVWKAVLDDHYRVSVRRTAPGRGRLEVMDEDTGRKLHDEEVNLSYDARFGPDVEDLARWRRIAIDVVDAHGSSERDGAVPES